MRLTDISHSPRQLSPPFCRPNRRGPRFRTTPDRSPPRPRNRPIVAVTLRPMVGSFSMGRGVFRTSGCIVLQGGWDPQPFSVGVVVVRHGPTLGSLGDPCTEDRSGKHRRDTVQEQSSRLHRTTHPRSDAMLGPIAAHSKKLSLGYSAWRIQTEVYRFSRDSSGEIDPVPERHTFFISVCKNNSTPYRVHRIYTCR